MTGGIGISLEQVITVMSFSIALGGFIVHIFFPSGQKKEALIATVMILLFVSSGTALYQSYEHKKHVEDISKEILGFLKNDTKTFEQIIDGVSRVDFSIASEAMDYLIESKNVGYEMGKATYSGNEYRVQTYYVRSFELP